MNTMSVQQHEGNLSLLFLKIQSVCGVHNDLGPRYGICSVLNALSVFAKTHLAHAFKVDFHKCLKITCARTARVLYCKRDDI